MKGKARYMEKLKAYMNGDDTVEVRMYNGQRMKVAELKPNKDSLRQLSRVSCWSSYRRV